MLEAITQFLVSFIIIVIFGPRKTYKLFSFYSCIEKKLACVHKSWSKLFSCFIDAILFVFVYI